MVKKKWEAPVLTEISQVEAAHNLDIGRAMDELNLIRDKSLRSTEAVMDDERDMQPDVYRVPKRWASIR